MHNNQDYLDAINELARKHSIRETAIIKEKNIGIHCWWKC